MRKTAKEINAEIFNKIKEIPEQARINRQIRAEGTEIIAEHNKVYGDMDLYRGILKKLKLLADDSSLIPFTEATVDCPEAFCFDYKKINPKTSGFFDYSSGGASETGIALYKEEDSGIGFCTLTITPKGKITFMVAETDDYMRNLDFSDAEGVSLLLNLPYLFREVVKNKNFFKIKQKLLNFIKANPVCTIANIYNYAKEKPEKLEELPENVAALEKYNNIFSEVRRNFGTEFEEIKNFFFIRKISSFPDKDLTVKYLIEKDENNEIFVKMDTSARETLAWLYDYPAKLLVKEDTLVPMFLPDSFFQKGEPNLGPAKEASLLLSKEAKLKNIMEGYRLRQTADTDLIGTEKYYREELNYRIRKVINQLKKFLNSKNISKLNEKEQKNLEILKTSQASLTGNINKISKVLAEIYKKEIVLNSL